MYAIVSLKKANNKQKNKKSLSLIIKQKKTNVESKTIKENICDLKCL